MYKNQKIFKKLLQFVLEYCIINYILFALGAGNMKLLEQKIIDEGRIYEGDVLKVDGFLNHRMDIAFIAEIGKEFYRLFADAGITKILTIEASGIGIACIAASYFEPVVPVVFAKKTVSLNIGNDLYSTKVFSYTKGKTYDAVVSKRYISPDDKILIIDDFLANGSALQALIDICRQAGAEVAGCGIVIEKAYQDGGRMIRNMGIRVESLAMIKSMSPQDGIEFC